MSQSRPTPGPLRPATAGGPAMPGPGERPLFRMRGIPVRIEWSCMLIAVLILPSLYRWTSGVLGPDGTVVAGLAAIVGTVFFFASILAHELGHAWVSLSRGIPVTGIRLLWMGGLTESRREPGSPSDEFVIVGIGPLVSLLLGGLFGVVALATQPLAVASVVARYLALVNVGLAVFNVLPGYPLDGGRLLRSVLWWVTGRPHQATRWAARVGQVFGGGLVAWAAWPLATGRATGSPFGLWAIVVGLFLFRSASDAYRRARMLEEFAGRVARDRMGSVPAALDPQLPLSDAIPRAQQRPSLLWPVGAPLVGVTRLGHMEAVPMAEWPSIRVGDVALPLEGRTVAAGAPLNEAIGALLHAPEEMLVVTEGGYAVGLLTPSLVAGSASG